MHISPLWRRLGRVDTACSGMNTVRIECICALVVLVVTASTPVAGQWRSRDGVPAGDAGLMNVAKPVQWHDSPTVTAPVVEIGALGTASVWERPEDVAALVQQPWPSIRAAAAAVGATTRYAFLRDARAAVAGLAKDIDLLVEDVDAARRALRASPFGGKAPERHCAVAVVDPNGGDETRRVVLVDFDLGTVGDGVFDARWEADMLRRARCHASGELQGVCELAPADEAFATMYHALHNKGRGDAAEIVRIGMVLARAVVADAKEMLRGAGARDEQLAAVGCSEPCLELMSRGAGAVINAAVDVCTYIDPDHALRRHMEALGYDAVAPHDATVNADVTAFAWAHALAFIEGGACSDILRGEDGSCRIPEGATACGVGTIPVAVRGMSQADPRRGFLVMAAPPARIVGAEDEPIRLELPEMWHSSWQLLYRALACGLLPGRTLLEFVPAPPGKSLSGLVSLHFAAYGAMCGAIAADVVTTDAGFAQVLLVAATAASRGRGALKLAVHVSTSADTGDITAMLRKVAHLRGLSIEAQRTSRCEAGSREPDGTSASQRGSTYRYDVVSALGRAPLASLHERSVLAEDDAGDGRIVALLSSLTAHVLYTTPDVAAIVSEDLDSLRCENLTSDKSDADPRLVACRRQYDAALIPRSSYLGDVNKKALLVSLNCNLSSCVQQAIFDMTALDHLSRLGRLVALDRGAGYVLVERPVNDAWTSRLFVQGTDASAGFDAEQSCHAMQLARGVPTTLLDSTAEGVLPVQQIGLFEAKPLFPTPLMTATAFKFSVCFHSANPIRAVGMGEGFGAVVEPEAATRLLLRGIGIVAALLRAGVSHRGLTMHTVVVDTAGNALVFGGWERAHVVGTSLSPSTHCPAEAIPRREFQSDSELRNAAFSRHAQKASASLGGAFLEDVTFSPSEAAGPCDAFAISRVMRWALGMLVPTSGQRVRSSLSVETNDTMQGLLGAAGRAALDSLSNASHCTAWTVEELAGLAHAIVREAGAEASAQ